ncbi:molybdopterin-guanine dinucleotide biosynthesis protein B [Desulfococcaceae bacterium HSG8]|nr:molybdopterin-guanine dinucleotide biosynthesis protein B [Desulfococcaceae bacterium HSG8]
MPQIISIVGKSGAGKTTLIKKLIPDLKKRGYRIGIIKHASHEFDIEKERRHGAAGADTVVLASAESIAMIKNHHSESLDSFQAYFQDVDIIIVEGYKRENKPKIEIFRAAAHKEPLCRENNDLIALVTDTDTDLNVPRFGLEEIGKLADFIEGKYLTMRDEVFSRDDQEGGEKDRMVELQEEIQERRDIEDTYRDLVDHAKDGIIIVHDFKVRFANPAFCRMSGFSKEELIGAHLRKFIGEEEFVRNTKRYSDRISGVNVPRIYESQFIRSDGSPVDVELNVCVVPYGKSLAALVFVRDMTEQEAWKYL